MSANEWWWHQPLRIIQPNMQVKDTARIDPERLAKQLKEMCANTVVFNVGGIYAWYRSEVPFHHVNEFLPDQGDLLQEMIECFHREGLRFVARYDFSKADDFVYQHRPEWFVRSKDGEPEIIGAKRPGNWSLLMSTCINTGYRNEALAVPVLRETLNQYDIDGVFFNNPGTIPCLCGNCQDKYQELYGYPMPEDRSELDRTWGSICLRDNMELLNGTIKEIRKEVPVLGYYNLFHESLEDRKAGSDLLCTEPQNVLSRGYRHIPEFWKPALSIKLGRGKALAAPPLGIVHSCPGMDWRHTGMPPAEYAFWLAQIPAYGGQIWHSLTGIPDTITDKRILRTVKAHNSREEKLAEEMHEAEALAETALLWHSGRSVGGWADGLVSRQIPFDILPQEEAGLVTLKRYRTVIVPELYPIGQRELSSWRAYVEQGGNLMVEGRLSSGPFRKELADLLGIEPAMTVSEHLTANYLRFEGTANPLQKGMEDTQLIPHRGHVVYCKPSPDAHVLATLVPPFSPLESVGAPPERASLSVPRTDIPLVVRHEKGLGSVLFLTFSLSELIDEFKLGEHYQLLDNLIDLSNRGERLLRVAPNAGLQATIYRNRNGFLLHFVNGTGRRPLAQPVPLHHLEVRLPLSLTGGIAEVNGLLENGKLPFTTDGAELRFTVPQVQVWEAVKITCGHKEPEQAR